jgi:hypothetical protein
LGKGDSPSAVLLDDHVREAALARDCAPLASVVSFVEHVLGAAHDRDAGSDEAMSWISVMVRTRASGDAHASSIARASSSRPWTRQPTKFTMMASLEWRATNASGRTDSFRPVR